MTFRKTLAALALFGAGVFTGTALQALIPQAHADEIAWSDVVRDPEFRAAVIEVVNSCIVENSIIYCN